MPREERVRELLGQVSRERLRRDLFCLACDPLPYRKLNATLPGHARSTLEEADDYLAAQLAAAGYTVEREPVAVQAFRCDSTKPKQSQFAGPEPDDPWYTAHNLYARHNGAERPDDTIVVIAHKDSQSWCDSPGAYDNAVGTVAALEIARALGPIRLGASVCFLWCNEEHTPWTSATAAANARGRGDHITAVLNLDGLGGRSQQDVDAGRLTQVAAYTVAEGRPLAELMVTVVERYGLGLEASIVQREFPNDDDGSFVKAGYGAAVLNIGSYPYADPCYHAESDTADRVDIENLYRATQAALAAVAELAGV